MKESAIVQKIPAAVTRPHSIDVVVIDLKAPSIAFEVTPHKGPLDTRRESTLEFINGEMTQVAINAHFFAPFEDPSTAPVESTNPCYFAICTQSSTSMRPITR